MSDRDLQRAILDGIRGVNQRLDAIERQVGALNGRADVKRLRQEETADRRRRHEQGTAYLKQLEAQGILQLGGRRVGKSAAVRREAAAPGVKVIHPQRSRQ
jgi:hypothetical protein